MRITIAAVGRIKAGSENELAGRYAKRFDGSGRALALGPITIVELPESRDGNEAVRRDDEAVRLLGKMNAHAVVVALDERGRNPDSQLFAKMLASARDDGVQEMAFLIGGPDGHGPAILERARETLSLSAMTLPHGLARIVLLEQLYRAATILAGHPYHRA